MRSEARSPLVRAAKVPGAYLPLPVLHQGPHEDDVAQSGEVPATGQRAVCLTAWLSFSREAGLVYQEICDLEGEKMKDSVPSP